MFPKNCLTLWSVSRCKKLLLVIDLQKGWRHKTATEGVMLNTVELCKKFKGDIVHCRFRNDPESLFHKVLHWMRFVEASDTDEIPVWVIIDCVGTLHGEQVHYYSLRSLSHGVGVKSLVSADEVLAGVS